jgi:hypothetical protein
MKKPEEEQDDEINEMLPEYELQGREGTRGKYYQLMRRGHIVVVHKEDGADAVRHYPLEESIILEPDVREYFPDSASVNQALRSLIALIPKRKAKKVAAPSKRRKLNL